MGSGRFGATGRAAWKICGAVRSTPVDRCARSRADAISAISGTRILGSSGSAEKPMADRGFGVCGRFSLRFRLGRRVLKKPAWKQTPEKSGEKLPAGNKPA